jgi:hypothetical protein
MAVAPAAPRASLSSLWRRAYCQTALNASAVAPNAML